MTKQGRTNSNENYRYGFNGKEKDTWAANGNIYDYGFRIYNPQYAKFLSVDPLTKSYPMLTPYQFASNRPIDGIDLDGLEFSKVSTFDENTGITHIKIVVNVRLDVSPDISDKKLINELVNGSKEQFSNVLGSVYNPVRKIQYSGELIYSENATIGLSVSPSVVREKPESLVTTGMAMPGYADVSIGIIEGDKTQFFSPTEFGLIVTHELLHQGGVVHPTENEAVNDVKLKGEGGRNYSTNSSTVDDIYYNIMLYSNYNVDGKNVGEVRGSEENANKLSPGQTNRVIENIDKGNVNGEAALGL